MNVYTPPGYSAEKKYPLLYLLYGIGGNEIEWERFAKPDALLDNLIAGGKAAPMIIVMPNGRAQKNDRAEGDVFKSAPAFAVFERDLLDDVIPAIESRYSTHKEREYRAPCRAVDGRRAIAEFRAGKFRQVSHGSAASPPRQTQRSPPNCCPTRRRPAN